ncbi:beta strand repeat-containing protein [Luteolibacter soli]|uniref:Autotransporter-associated beta strand repeat-containing protein n=1 Tax=Luteolibacter soli TaxID=3135280 RepID=A0ABU9B1Q7_9BACT
MKPNRRSQLLHLANVTLAAPAAWAILSASAQGGSATWANTGTNWNADASWTPATGFPGTAGTTDVATFTGAATTQPAVAAPVTIGGIAFSDTAAASYTISGSALTLTSTGTGATTSAVHSANTSGTNTISAPIVLGGAAATTARFNQGTNGTLALNGVISSTNAITGTRFEPISNNVASVFTLAANNTFAGTSTLGFATFNVNNPGAFSTGTIVYSNNPRFNNTSGAPITIANAQTIGTNFTYSGADANSNLTFSGNLNMSGGNRTVNTTTAGGKLIFSGAVDVGTGTRQHIKDGPGALGLTGTMTGTGLNQTIGGVVYNNCPWRANAGILEVGNAAVLGGALDFRATLQASTPLTLPTTIVHATNNATLGGANNLTLSGSYILSNGANSRTLIINNTGTTTLSGTVSLTDLSTDATQTLTVSVDPVAGASLISGVVQNLAGGGASTNPMGFTKIGGGDLTLSNANTFAGTLTVSGGRLIGTNSAAFGASSNTISVTSGGTLQPDGNLTYTVNGPLTVATGGVLRLGLGSTNGVNDKITGSGAISMNGLLMIDLPVTNPPDGSSFTLFTQAVSYNTGSFTVVDPAFFQWSGSAVSGLWTYDSGSGIYTYNQATKTVTFAADSDADGLPDAWERSFFPGDLTKLFTGGDFDNDGAYDEQEYAGGSNPKNAASVPGDVDGDSLPDAWENIFYPGDLTKLSGLGGADKDGDGISDLAEYTGNSSPADASWKPNQASLKHRWSFTTGAGQLNDSVGTSNATILNPGAANPATFSGDAVTLAGGAKASSEAINLGSNLISEGFPVTIELWATQNAVQNSSRIFDFNAGSNSEYLFMNWTEGTNLNSDKLEWKDFVTTPSLASTNAPYVLGKKYHIVVTLIPAEFTGGALTSGTRVVWYKAPADGPTSHSPLWTQRGTFDTSNQLSQLSDAIGALGQASSGDNTASATYDEVRIWHGVLGETEREVAQAVGTGVTNLTTDADGDGMVDSWEARYGITSPTAQDDGDGENNLAEFLAHTNPKDTASNSADRDGDGLNDVDFELYYFGDLDETGSGDSDGDFANNELEESSFTSPLNNLSWPDTEDGVGDGLNDGWEEYYFGDRDGVIEAGELAQIATGDPDGDGEDNATEYNNRTNPTDWFSRAVVPSLFALIDGSTRNGQFELQGPPPGVASGTKRASWDQAGAADVTYWTEWAPYNTTPNNSGVEGGTGLQHAFMESGNAMYNLTDYKAAQGTIYWFAFDKSNGNQLDAYLVYEDANGAIQPITASLFSSTTAGNNQLKGYQIPAGSPAIGRRIGIGFRSFSSWAAFDNVRLGVTPSDVDADGYDDTYEDLVWGDNDGVIEASDRAAGPAGDVDGDGIPTLVELNGSANTLYGNQPTKPNLADSDGDGLSDGVEMNLTTGTQTNPNVADTDGDGLNDGLEVNTYGTNPLAVDSDFDGFADGVEALYYGTNPNDINSVPNVHELIGLTKHNGSFELLGPVPGTVNAAKAGNWDTAAAGDVTYWTIWTEQSTASNDSGTETTASTFRHGAKHAFLQSGNAVYNPTSYQLKAGDTIRLTYSRTVAGTLSAYLVVNTGSGIVQLPGSTIQVTTDAKDGYEMVFVVPNGHASIGQSLGVAFKNTGGGNTFPGVDKVALSVQDRDTDADGLSDFWEDLYWGGGDDLVLAGELNQAKGTAAQALPGSADPDGDGTDNLTEFRLGLNPADGTSGFKVTALQKDPSSFSLTWPSATGVTFKIERSTTLGAGSWTSLDAAFPGAAGTTTYTDNSLPAGAKAFYKVTLNP